MWKLNVKFTQILSVVLEMSHVAGETIGLTDGRTVGQDMASSL